jgi:adhesin transport system membrane fusion protein
MTGHSSLAGLCKTCVRATLAGLSIRRLWAGGPPSMPVSSQLAAFRGPMHGIAPVLTPASATPLLVWSALAMLVMGGGSAVLEIDDVINAPVRIEPSSQIRHIQHFEGGTIHDIMVHEGDEVTEGTVLVRLVNSQGAEDFAERLARLSAQKARVARLRADLSGNQTIFWPTDTPIDEATKQREMTLHLERLSHHTDQTSVIGREIDRRQHEIAEMESKVSGLTKTTEKIGEEMAIRTKAFEAGVVGRNDLVRLERDQLTLQGELATTRMSVERLRAQMREAEAKLTEFEKGWQTEVLEDIGKTETEIRALTMTIVVANDREGRSELRSPVHGIVKMSAVTSIGQVAKPGETLMDIVPMDDTLVVEARIAPQDIGHIREGLAASVRLSAFDQFRFGSLDGDVTMVGADAIDDARTGIPYYKAVIRVHRSSLRDSKDREFAIRPGMVGTAAIVIGRKSILRTVLEPLLRNDRLIDQAFRGLSLSPASDSK